MYATDFEYDGHYLSDFGFMVCDFGSRSDFDNINAGARITFNTVPINHGRRYGLAGSKYGECIQATFNVCKDPCVYDGMKVTNDEYRDLMRWLNRREFLRFRFIKNEDDDDTCYFDASFNIEKVLVNRDLYGLKITMETNKPFGYGQEEVHTLASYDSSKVHLIRDMSDDVGFIFPDMKITINESGNLTIVNQSMDCTMVINNCVQGEVITIHGDAHIITSSLDSHKLWNDFNYEFMKLGNTIDDRSNKITISLPSTVEFRYTPIIKDVPE